MTTDHNEAMRLADALDAPTVTHHQVSRDWEPYETVERVVEKPAVNKQAAALIRKQAERIAELELQPAFAQLASDLAAKLADTEAERDTLRAEVERLRVDAERWHAANLTAETAWKHPDHRSPEENTAFSAYRCAVEDGLNFEGAVDAAVAAIDTARKEAT